MIGDLNDEGIPGTLYEKEIQKTHQTGFGIEKAIKKKGDKLYAK